MYYGDICERMTTWPRKGNSNYKSGLNGNYDLCETSHRSFHSGILNLQIHHENIARLSILGNGELGSQGIRGGQLPLRCVVLDGSALVGAGAGGHPPSGGEGVTVGIAGLRR